MQCDNECYAIPPLPLFFQMIILSHNDNFKSSAHIQLKTTLSQVFSEHKQAPTPPKSFSSISEVSMTFRSKVLSRTSLRKNRYFWLFWLILQLSVGCFDRNDQKAHIRTKIFHLSL